jgi:hypothetical protein
MGKKVPSTLKWETKDALYIEMRNRRYILHSNGGQKVPSTLKWEKKGTLYIEMGDKRYPPH